MAALALAVGACLVQTRFSKRKLPYIDSTMGVATFGGIASRTYVALRPSSIQKRCAEVVQHHQGALCKSGARLLSCFRAGLRQEDPPNLNILLSGGKETNKDSLSNGE